MIDTPQEDTVEEPGQGLSMPGDDEEVASYDSLSVIDVVMACKQEAEAARKTRERLNEINYDAMHCRADNSGKIAGMSREFLPKVSMALEQVGALIEKGLTAGDYFSTSISPEKPPLTSNQITKLIRHRLEAPEEIVQGCLDFATTVTDAAKTACLASLFILKVHGHFVPVRKLSVDVTKVDHAFLDPVSGQGMTVTLPVEETLSFEETKVWRLLVEAVRPEDYFPDPTGRCMYEVHRTWKDLYEVIDLAEAGEYDQDAVAQLAESCQSLPVDEELEHETNQPEGTTPSFRKQVEILEYWGHILDSDGNLQQRNIRCVIANDKYLIRRPEPNPYWHQESPFVAVPLLRVPFSVWHKALFDNATRLNLAANELFNLMTDGAMGAVWGVRQVKMGMLENPQDFTNGIAQGAVAILKDEAPDGVPAIMITKTGEVPQDAMNMFGVIERAFDSASMLNETAQGKLPKKEVRATEIAASEQASSTFFDSIIGRVERGIEKAIRLAWLTMLQNADDWNAEDVVGLIDGPEAAAQFAQMSPARRYMTYAQGARFKVFGLTSMVARGRVFQKLVTAMGMITQSPILSQAFMNASSPQKLLEQIFKSLDINMDDLKLSAEEQAALPQTLQQLPFFQGMASGAQGNQQTQGAPQQTPGSLGQQAQATVSQVAQPPQTI